MKMDNNIRVRTDRKYRRLYNELRQLVVGDMHDIFFICACLGYRRKKVTPLGKSGEERFWSGTISPEEWCCFYSMIVEENNMDFNSIQDDVKVIARIEEYANAGMEMLINEFLCDYLTNSDEEKSIEHGLAKELPKTFLNHIFELCLPSINELEP